MASRGRSTNRAYDPVTADQWDGSGGSAQSSALIPLAVLVVAASVLLLRFFKNKGVLKASSSAHPHRIGTAASCSLIGLLELRMPALHDRIVCATLIMGHHCCAFV